MTRPLLLGKTAVVTGAGRGQGEAVARRFSAEGAAVVVADIAQGGAERVAQEIQGDGGRAVAAIVDVTRSDDVARMVDLALGRFGGLDVLYNNAGIYLTRDDAPTVELREEIFDRVIAVNLKSVFLSCRAALPPMLERGRGVILNVGSVASYAGDPVAHAYAAAKGGLIAYTRSLAAHYGPSGIRANVVCPGFIDTPMIADMLQDGDARERIVSSTMLRRLGTPVDVAGLAAFLASDEASFITGTTLVVDGGLVK